MEELTEAQRTAQTTALKKKQAELKNTLASLAEDEPELRKGVEARLQTIDEALQQQLPIEKRLNSAKEYRARCAKRLVAHEEVVKDAIEERDAAQTAKDEADAKVAQLQAEFSASLRPAGVSPSPQPLVLQQQLSVVAHFLRDLGPLMAGIDSAKGVPAGSGARQVMEAMQVIEAHVTATAPTGGTQQTCAAQQQPGQPTQTAASSEAPTFVLGESAPQVPSPQTPIVQPPGQQAAEPRLDVNIATDFEDDELRTELGNRIRDPTALDRGPQEGEDGEGRDRQRSPRRGAVRAATQPFRAASGGRQA